MDFGINDSSPESLLGLILFLYSDIGGSWQNQIVLQIFVVGKGKI